MTELMLRYEKETGKEAEARVTAVFQGTSRKIMFFTDEYVEWLEALLTWRDVSEELPEQYEHVLFKNCEASTIREMALDGDCWKGVYGDVKLRAGQKWLPIQKEQS